MPTAYRTGSIHLFHPAHPGPDLATFRAAPPVPRHGVPVEAIDADTLATLGHGKLLATSVLDDPAGPYLMGTVAWPDGLERMAGHGQPSARCLFAADGSVRKVVVEMRPGDGERGASGTDDGPAMFGKGGGGGKSGGGAGKGSSGNHGSSGHGKLSGGRWATIHGHPIYIKDGQVVAGGVPGLTHDKHGKTPLGPVKHHEAAGKVPMHPAKGGIQDTAHAHGGPDHERARDEKKARRDYRKAGEAHAKAKVDHAEARKALDDHGKKTAAGHAALDKIAADHKAASAAKIDGLKAKLGGLKDRIKAHVARAKADWHEVQNTKVLVDHHGKDVKPADYNPKPAPPSHPSKAVPAPAPAHAQTKHTPGKAGMVGKHDPAKQAALQAHQAKARAAASEPAPARKPAPAKKSAEPYNKHDPAGGVHHTVDSYASKHGVSQSAARAHLESLKKSGHVTHEAADDRYHVPKGTAGPKSAGHAQVAPGKAPGKAAGRPSKGDVIRSSAPRDAREKAVHDHATAHGKRAMVVTATPTYGRSASGTAVHHEVGGKRVASHFVNSSGKYVTTLHHRDGRQTTKVHASREAANAHLKAYVSHRIAKGTTRHAVVGKELSTFDHAKHGIGGSHHKVTGRVLGDGGHVQFSEDDGPDDFEIDLMDDGHDGPAMFARGGGARAAKSSTSKPDAPDATSKGKSPKGGHASPSKPGGCGTGAGGFKAGNTCGHKGNRNATVEAARAAHTAAKGEVMAHLKAHARASKAAARTGEKVAPSKELHGAIKKAAAAHVALKGARDTHRAEQRERRNAARREGRKAGKERVKSVEASKHEAAHAKPTPAPTTPAPAKPSLREQADKPKSFKETLGHPSARPSRDDRASRVLAKAKEKLEVAKDQRGADGPKFLSKKNPENAGNRAAQATQIKRARAIERSLDPAVSANLAAGKARAARRDAQQGKLNLAGEHTPGSGRPVPASVKAAVVEKRSLREQAAEHRAKKGDVKDRAKSTLAHLEDRKVLREGFYRNSLQGAKDHKEYANSIKDNAMGGRLIPSEKKEIADRKSREKTLKDQAAREKAAVERIKGRIGRVKKIV